MLSIMHSKTVGEIKGMKKGGRLATGVYAYPRMRCVSFVVLLCFACRIHGWDSPHSTGLQEVCFCARRECTTHGFGKLDAEAFQKFLAESVAGGNHRFGKHDLQGLN